MIDFAGKNGTDGHQIDQVMGKRSAAPKNKTSFFNGLLLNLRFALYHQVKTISVMKGHRHAGFGTKETGCLFRSTARYSHLPLSFITHGYALSPPQEMPPTTVQMLSGPNIPPEIAFPSPRTEPQGVSLRTPVC